jgi:hypothetical protein
MGGAAMQRMIAEEIEIGGATPTLRLFMLRSFCRQSRSLHNASLALRLRAGRQEVLGVRRPAAEAILNFGVLYGIAEAMP